MNAIKRMGGVTPMQGCVACVCCWLGLAYSVACWYVLGHYTDVYKIYECTVSFSTRDVYSADSYDIALIFPMGFAICQYSDISFERKRNPLKTSHSP